MTSERETKIQIIARVLDISSTKAEEVVKAATIRPKENEVIPICEVLKQFGWSASTGRRRFIEYGLKLIPVPGWKTKKGVYASEFEKKTGLKLKNKEVN